MRFFEPISVATRHGVACKSVEGVMMYFLGGVSAPRGNGSLTIQSHMGSGEAVSGCRSATGVSLSADTTLFLDGYSFSERFPASFVVRDPSAMAVPVDCNMFRQQRLHS